MGTSCTNPLVTQGKRFYFRACFIDPFQGAGAATYAVETLKMKKAALIVDVANDYSVGLASFFKQSYKKQGGEIVAELKYNSGDQDFTAQLTEISALHFAGSQPFCLEDRLINLAEGDEALFAQPWQRERRQKAV